MNTVLRMLLCLSATSLTTAAMAAAPREGESPTAVDTARRLSADLNARRLTRTRIREVLTATTRAGRDALIEVWKRVSDASPRAVRVYRDMLALRVDPSSTLSQPLGTDRRPSADLGRVPAATTVRPDRGPEIGLQAGQVGASFLALVAWRSLLYLFSGGGELIGPDNALGILALDAAISTLLVGGVTYGVASASASYEPSFAPAWLGAVGAYGLGTAVSLVGAASGDRDAAVAGALVGLIGMPVASTAAVHFTKEPIVSRPPVRPEDARVSGPPRSLPALRSVSFAVSF